MNITANRAWHTALGHVHRHGRPAKPRGQGVLETMGYLTAIDMTTPVVTLPDRKLNHDFMLGEALWIVTGSDRVADCHAMPRMMRECSDDGVTMAGAYGPRFVAQRDYVVERLVEDPYTRQATMTLWTPSPAPSKDVPCTVAMTFQLRSGLLHNHVFMRSSDVWLGLPYDLFSFTMMTCSVVGALRLALKKASGELYPIRPGMLMVTSANLHLYNRDVEKAERCLVDNVALYDSVPSKVMPPLFYDGVIQDTEGALRIAIEHPAARWWT